MTEIFGGVDALARALDYHLERHNVIASNVANVDTPGFTPFELLRAREGELSHSLRAQRTHDQHLSAGGENAPGELVAVADPAVQPGNDGNSVSLEHEMSKLAANDLRYEGATRIIARQLAMLRYAASGGQGR